MKEEEEKKLMKLLKNMSECLEGTVDIHTKFSNLLGRIIDLIEFLMKITSIIFFVLSILIWRVFLWDPIKAFFNIIGDRWILLPENYKILVLGFIGAIIAGIVAHIAGALLLEKIKDILKNKK